MATIWRTDTTELPMQDGMPGGSVTVHLPPGAKVFDPAVVSGKLRYVWGLDRLPVSPAKEHILTIVRRGCRGPGTFSGTFVWKKQEFSLFQQSPV